MSQNNYGSFGSPFYFGGKYGADGYFDELEGNPKTIVQSLSDFYPTWLEPDFEKYRSWPMPKELIYDLSYNIPFNVYMGRIGEPFYSDNPREYFNHYSKISYYDWVRSDALFRDTRRRFNIVIGYNRLNRVTGDGNIYIGRNANTYFTLDTNYSVNLGNEIKPIKDIFTLKTNPTHGILTISPPKKKDEVYKIDAYKNNTFIYSNVINQLTDVVLKYENYLLYVKDSNETIENSIIRTNNVSISTNNSTIYQNNITESITNSNIRVNSTNQNLSGSYIVIDSTNEILSTSNIFQKNLNENITDSNIRIYSTNQNLSTSNITLTGTDEYIIESDIYQKLINESITSSNIRIDSTTENISSSKITIDDSDIYQKGIDESITDSNIRIHSTTQNISSSKTTIDDSDIYQKNIDESITDSNIRIHSTTQNISSCTILLSSSTFDIHDSNAKLTNMTVALGTEALSDRDGMYSVMHSGFGTNGDAQRAQFLLYGKTTSSTLTEIFCDGDGGSKRMIIPTDKVWSGVVNILGTQSDGTYVSRFLRQVTIKNDNGSVSLVGSVITLGTDVTTTISVNNFTSIDIDADNTNKSLRIRCRGLNSNTWRWIASAEGAEITMGT
jgi:hypothetical protein